MTIVHHQSVIAQLLAQGAYEFTMTVGQDGTRRGFRQSFAGAMDPTTLEGSTWNQMTADGNSDQTFISLISPPQPLGATVMRVTWGTLGTWDYPWLGFGYSLTQADQGTLYDDLAPFVGQDIPITVVLDP